MIVTTEIDRLEYVGAGEWDEEEGFSVALQAYLSEENFIGPTQLPDILPITIDKNRRGILVRPHLSVTGGLNLGVDRPATKSIHIRSSCFVCDMPWELPEAPRVSEIRVSSRALALWYGDDSPIINIGEAIKTAEVKFECKSHKYQIALGKLFLELGFSIPGAPYIGEYNFRTDITARLQLFKRVDLLEAQDYIMRLEGFFDLLSAFSARALKASIVIEDLSNPCQIKVAIRNFMVARKAHPFRIFINSKNFDAGRVFQTYFENYNKINLLQSTARYLSKDSLVLPEGFLTACNIIEFLGKDAPNSRAEVDSIAGDIEYFLKTKGDTDIINKFSELKSKIYTESSFKDRFNFVAGMVAGLGITVTLPPGKVRDARARYRHDIVHITNADIDVMRATVGYAWFIALVWLCKGIGIDCDIVKGAARNEVFHLQRGTNLPLWGKFVS